MKKLVLLTAFLITIITAGSQSVKFGPFTCTLPEGFKMAKEKKLALISDPDGRICFILSIQNAGQQSPKENFYTWWNTRLPFPEYVESPIPELTFAKQNGYECVQTSTSAPLDDRGLLKQACIYQTGINYHSYMIYSNGTERKGQYDELLKSLKIDPPAVVAALSPLEKSYNWYTALKGIQPSLLPVQSYQASGNINLTGFISPYPEYMLRLGDSLVHLNVLQSLRQLFVGQSQLTDNAARHIGMHPGLRSFATVSQGLTIPITDAGLQYFSVSRTIEDLDLRSPDIPQVTNTGLGYLARMTQLKNLRLSRAPGITISGIEQLTTLRQLENLDLSGCTITDADMPRLRAVLLQMPLLQSINLMNCGLSYSGTEAIRNLRPSFAILF